MIIDCIFWIYCCMSLESNLWISLQWSLRNLCLLSMFWKFDMRPQASLPAMGADERVWGLQADLDAGRRGQNFIQRYRLRWRFESRVICNKPSPHHYSDHLKFAEPLPLLEWLTSELSTEMMFSELGFVYSHLTCHHKSLVLNNLSRAISTAVNLSWSQNRKLELPPG